MVTKKNSNSKLNPKITTGKQANEYQFGFHNNVKPIFKTQKGISPKIVNQISWQKKEPAWMNKFRLKALKTFIDKPIPLWGGDLSQIKFSDIYYYLKPIKKKGKSWNEVPKNIKETFEKLGIPQAERKYLAGVETQYDSEAIYGSLKKDLVKKGIIFTNTDEALSKYPEFFKEYFGKIVPPADNKFAALNSTFWSGGSFIYIPKNVKVDLPLQAYFRINAASMGQFERTLIIADCGSFVHYIEGCTAPIYTSDSLHSAVVEIFVKKGARVRYTTIQNWSKNVYNLVTKRAVVDEEGTMEWVDGNLGSKLTMKYPSIYLKGRKATGEVLSVAMAGNNQHQDVGAKVYHLSPETSSRITSKSVSKSGGRTGYRGLVYVAKGAKNSNIRVSCDALILDGKSRADTYPTMNINEQDANIEHEASVSKVSEEQLFYLQSRGIPKDEAASMIVNGFIEPIVRELPMEYAVELNRLMKMEMEGSVG